MNPFAKKDKSPTVEVGSLIGSVLVDAISLAGSSIRRADERLTPMRFFEARCGGRRKPNSIKQRTRLNRDRRNQARRDARINFKFRWA